MKLEDVLATLQEGESVTFCKDDAQPAMRVVVDKGLEREVRYRVESFISHECIVNARMDVIACEVSRALHRLRAQADSGVEDGKGG